MTEPCSLQIMNVLLLLIRAGRLVFGDDVYKEVTLYRNIPTALA